MNELLTRLRDVLSEHMQDEDRGTFIEDFDSLLAKRDTSGVRRQFAIWMLIDPAHGVIRFTKPGTEEHHAIQRVAQLFIDDCKDAAACAAAACAAASAGATWSAACAAACAAAWSAACVAAAWSAARWSAASSAAAWSATCAGATWSAASAAAWSAACAAASAGASVADWEAPCAAAYRAMADKLIELIKQAPEKT